MKIESFDSAKFKLNTISAKGKDNSENVSSLFWILFQIKRDYECDVNWGIQVQIIKWQVQTLVSQL